MSDNLYFPRFVPPKNPPAARQYQPANSGYPPSSSQNQPQLLDPFFDDDDDVPDSAFGRPPPSIRSEQNGLPLVQGAVPPAGSGPSKPANAIAPEWVFDDDPFHPASDPPFPGSDSFPGPFRAEENRTAPRRSKWRKWKWPWQKDKIVLGERVVALNNESANVDFCSNFVSTSKYNTVTFLPKFLTGTHSSIFIEFRFSCLFSVEQFSKYANI